MSEAFINRVLTIAGSDSGAGAGIQADLKALTACGVYGTTAITAVTAQNTEGVFAVEQIPPETIVAQVRAVADDIGVDAVKVGMLGTAETVDAVIQALDLVGDVPVVVDPVMVAESGAVLLDEAARTALVERLLPLATVVTPNIPEARALTGADERASQEDLAREMLALGPEAVVVTGGHSDRVVDFFFDGFTAVEIHGNCFPDGAAHGSGCTYSATLAAMLTLGRNPLRAAERAREVTELAIRDGLHVIGQGAGPVDVFGLAWTQAAIRRPEWLDRDASAIPRQ